MEWVKTTAKTLPEAIDLALDNLGVDESDAEIVVLEEPRTGLFGRVKGTARVEARVKPKQSRPKQERRKNTSKNKGRGERSGRNGGRSGGDRNRSQNKSKDGGNKGRGQQSNGQAKKQGQRGQQGAQADRQSNNSETVDANSGGRQAASDSGEQGREQGGRDRGGRQQGGGSRGGRNRGGNNGGSGGRNKRNSEGHARSDKKTDSGPKVETPVEDVKNHLEQFLTGLTEAFGFEGPVTVDESPEDGLTGQVAGQHGLMVGPKGRTLDAIQELARISSSRKVPSSVRIKVDVGGYRFQRSAALGEFATKAADKAVENSVEVALDPMSAADRKAVHDALSEDDRVETRSVGTDPRRKVLVVPVVQTDTDDDLADDGDDLVEAAAGDSAGAEE